MNFVPSYQEPLPLALPDAHADPRRQRFAGLKLADAAMLGFNSELHAVNEQAPPVDADQVMSLARWLQSVPPATASATIELRLARAESLRRMLDDPDWTLPAGLAERGRRLLAYIGRLDDLIPDEMPVIGHLDEALLVELSWSEFAGEVQDYLHFRNFCRDNHVRGSAGERRSAWESACLAEASQMLHKSALNERGYSRPQPLSRTFRVY
jgi:hypothetical protein